MSALHRDSLKKIVADSFLSSRSIFCFLKVPTHLAPFMSLESSSNRRLISFQVFSKNHYNYTTDLVKENAFEANYFWLWWILLDWWQQFWVLPWFFWEWLWTGFAVDAVQIKWQNLLFYTVFAPKSDALKVLPGHEICATPGRKKWQEFFD